MNADRAALIAAILAHPEEDTPRLACADWFQEQGDEASVARAEFIRTQIARANLSPTDPRQSELYARELRLLKKYAAVWCGSHFVFKKCRFRRGFIEYVHLHLRHFLFHRRQMLALEPVRDISLTGWMRATDELVRRVAACEEWKHIETLRIHHQGPHKDPQSNLVILLESPHLSRLQSLRLPRIAITADARRRFEQASVICQLRELTLPELDFYPHEPGEWFEGGPPDEPWENLRVLRLRTDSINSDVLSQLVAMPFWRHLTELDIHLGWSGPEPIHALTERLPDTLRVVRLIGASPWEGGPTMESLCARLAQLPLLGLHLCSIPSEPHAIEPIFHPSSHCRLKELTLSDCNLHAEHARMIAQSPGLRDVWSLDLSKDWRFPPHVAEIVFQSDSLRSVARLNMRGTPIGVGGAKSLVAAEWKTLRYLDLPAAGIPERSLIELFASPTCHNLVSLSYDGESSPDLFTISLAESLLSLPHLASLKVNDHNRLVDEAGEVLRRSESLAWLAEDPAQRENWGDFDPNILPPLDDELAHVDQCL